MSSPSGVSCNAGLKNNFDYANNQCSHDVTIMGYQVPMTGMTLLGLFGGLELLTAWKGSSVVTDYAGHLTSMAAGIAAAWYIRRQAAQREMTRKNVVPGSSEENP